MKTKQVAVIATLVIGLGTLTPQTQAGDREWAVAGKVLTGVVAASVLSRALDPAPPAATTAVVYQQPVYVAPPPVYYPPPTVVYHPAPPQVIHYAPPPTVVIHQPVYYAPGPVFVPAPQPVMIRHPHRRMGFRAGFCW